VDIKATINQLTAERDKLDKAIEALRTLEDSSAAAPRAAAPRAARRRRAPRRAATSNGASASSTTALTPAKVVRLVTTNGVAASKIREQTGGSADAVLRVLKQLESDGAVKRTGERRSTKWHLSGK
jgi:predicted HTH transcriptional regulator